VRECDETFGRCTRGAVSSPRGCLQVFLRPLIELRPSLWIVSRSPTHISVRDSLRQCKLSTARSLVQYVYVREVRYRTSQTPATRKATVRAVAWVAGGYQDGIFCGVCPGTKRQLQKIEGTLGRRSPSPVLELCLWPGGPSVGGTFAMGRVHQPRRSAPNRRRGPGERLRALRLVLGLSLRAVHGASIMISRRLRNSEFLLPASRLHEFETRNVVPSIHRLYTLACIYEYEIIDLLGWYGIPRRRVSPARIDTTGRP
jgi:transcriptional regulator with XRE-family HTH domain